MGSRINGIFILIITLLVISTFSKEQLKHKRGTANGYLSPITPLGATPSPVVRDYSIVLSLVNLPLDGYTKQVYSIDGQYPGTIIHANKGDTLRVNVTNKLGFPSVLHWHGIDQVGSTWFDGVTGLSQCSIPDGVSFVYEFSTGIQSGTYWYHAHIHGQYMAGLRGALIVHDPEDPYLDSYDFDYALTMSDWYHQSIPDLVELQSAPGYAGTFPIPDSGLISGYGRYNCSAAAPGHQCQDNSPLAVYSVTPGKRYRFRILNTSGGSHFVFSIDNHPLTIIEADGTYTKNKTVNKLPLHIAQRYSVIITANQKVDNYWIRATLSKECNPAEFPTLNFDSAINYNVTGILRYDGAGTNDPTSEEFQDVLPSCLGLAPDFLDMLFPEEVPGGKVHNIDLNVTFGITDTNVTVALINNSSFTPSELSPTLEAFMNNQTAFPLNQNLYSYNQPNGTIEITLRNRNGVAHPFHIHGHNFWVLGTGQGNKVDRSKFVKNPFSRDSFAVNASSWTVFRFKADNPGVWAFHCHIDWHVELGMMVQFLELPDLLSKMVIPASVQNLCKFSQSKKRSLPPGLPERPRRISKS